MKKSVSTVTDLIRPDAVNAELGAWAASMGSDFERARAECTSFLWMDMLASGMGVPTKLRMQAIYPRGQKAADICERFRTLVSVHDYLDLD